MSYYVVMSIARSRIELKHSSSIDLDKHLLQHAKKGLAMRQSKERMLNEPSPFPCKRYIYPLFANFYALKLPLYDYISAASYENDLQF